MSAPGSNPTDALLGVAWWNRLTTAERAHWLDVAWKRISPPGRYTLDTMPSAADAWAAFQSGHGAAADLEPLPAIVGDSWHA